MAMQKLMKVAWFSTKGAIVGGAVYVSIDQAIWTDSNHVKLQETVRNIKEMLPLDLNVAESLPLPKKDENVNVNFRSYWNSGVFWTFGAIADFPSKVIGVKNSIFSFASSPSAPSAASVEMQRQARNRARPIMAEQVAEVTTASAPGPVEVAPESTEPLEAAAVAQEVSEVKE